MFSDQHIALMRKFQNGAEWFPFKDTEEDAAMRYLIAQNIIAADLTRGSWDTFFLTEHGKSILSDITEKQRKADDQQTKAKANEAKRAEERRQDKADSERQSVASNKTAVIASLVSAIIETCIPGIIRFTRSLFH